MKTNNENTTIKNEYEYRFYMQDGKPTISDVMIDGKLFALGLLEEILEDAKELEDMSKEELIKKIREMEK